MLSGEMVTPDEDVQLKMMLESVTVIVPEWVILLNLTDSVYVLLLRPVRETKPTAGAGKVEPEQGYISAELISTSKPLSVICISPALLSNGE